MKDRENELKREFGERERWVKGKIRKEEDERLREGNERDREKMKLI